MAEIRLAILYIQFFFLQAIRCSQVYGCGDSCAGSLHGWRSNVGKGLFKFDLKYFLLCYC